MKESTFGRWHSTWLSLLVSFSYIYQVHRLFSYSSSLLMIILLLFNYSFPVHLHYFTRGLSIWIINSTINMYYSDINYKWSIKLVYISKNKCWKRRRMLGQPFWLILLLIPFDFFLANECNQLPLTFSINRWYQIKSRSSEI